MLPAALPAAALPADRPIKNRGGRRLFGTILLVEDEPAVREFAVAALSSHGYRVLQATSGYGGVEVWKWHQSRIALLVTDLVLPDGLRRRWNSSPGLRHEKPALKASLLTIGYANDPADGSSGRPPGVLFIHKPYQPGCSRRRCGIALDDH